MYKYNAATYVDVYQAALMRRRTPRTCTIYTGTDIYIYIYGYAYMDIYICITSGVHIK